MERTTKVGRDPGKGEGSPKEGKVLSFNPADSGNSARKFSPNDPERGPD